MTSQNIQFKLSATDQSAAAFASMTRRLAELETKLKATNSSAGLVKGGLAALAGVASVGAFGALIQSTIDASSKLVDMSAKTAVPLDALQRLQYAAEQSGVEIGTLEGALDKLNRKLGQAKAGDQKSIDLFKSLGIDPEKIGSADEAISALADTFKTLGSDPEALQFKAAILKELKLDPSLIPMLDAGAEGIKKMGDRLAEFGGIVDDVTLNSIESLGDKLAETKKLSFGLAAQFVGGLTPSLSGILDGMTDAKGGAESFAAAGRMLGGVLSVLATSADVIFTAFTGVGNLLGAAGAQAAALFRGDFAGAAEIKVKYVEDKKATFDALVKRTERRFSTPDQAPEAAATDSEKAAAAKAAKAAKNKLKGYLGKNDEDGASKKEKAENEYKILKAQQEAESKLRVDTEKRVQEQLKNALEDGTISYRDYYAQLISSQQAATDVRIKSLTEERKATKLKSEQAKLDAEIILLERERAEIAGDAARVQAKAEKDLVKELDALEIKTKEILGTITPDDRKKILSTQFEKLRQQAVQSGRDPASIDRAIGIQAAADDFKATQDRAGQVRSSGASQTRQIETQRDAGLLSNSDARQSIAEVNRKTAESLRDMLPALQAQADLLGGAYIDAVRDAETELKQLELTADSVAATINSDIQTGLSDAIYAVATGSKSPAQALKDLFAGVGNSIAKQVSDDLASDLYKNLKSGGFDIGGMISSLLGGKSGGGGAAGAGMMASAGSWISSLFGFESGGYTGGSGVSSVAGVVHGREYVMSAPAVQSLGVGFLDALHNSARAGAPRSNLPGFANGGYTGSGKSMGGGGVTVMQNITTKDAESFRRSQGQIQAQTGTAISRATRRNT